MNAAGMLCLLQLFRIFMTFIVGHLAPEIPKGSTPEDLCSGKNVPIKQQLIVW